MLKFMFPLMIFIFLFMEYWSYMILLSFIIFFFLLLNLPLASYYNTLNLFNFDYLSYGMILLSGWIIILMILASMKVNYLKNSPVYFIMIIFLLMFFLYLTFLTTNMLFFYILFESSLLPTFLLIIGFGYQPERLQAGLYMLFYTLFASLPLLMSIFYYSGLVDCMSMNIYLYNSVNKMMYLSFILAFLVKLPMYFFHLWLPKAHVEAPISGSMILAAVLLKLGGYGLMRLFIYVMKFNLYFNYWFLSLGLIGSTYISINCLRQLDMKMLIAYSSVVHMGLVLGGLFTLSKWGFNGSYLIMLGHGLCSSGLFCLANLSYERVLSRNILFNKGVMNFMPSVALWWFLLVSSNMAAPPSLNLLAEISLIVVMITWSQYFFYLIFVLSFFSAAYCLYLYSYTQHGVLFSGVYSVTNGCVREFHLLFMHWLPLNILFMISSFLIV